MNRNINNKPLNIIKIKPKKEILEEYIKLRQEYIELYYKHKDYKSKRKLKN